jgi:ATP-binding cassette, subfamily C, bacterial
MTSRTGQFVRRVLPARAAAGVTALALLVALLESVGILLLVPLLALVGIDPGDGAIGGIAAAVGGALAAAGIPLTLAAVLLVYLGVIAIQAGVTRAETLVSMRVREATALRMRRLLYQAIAGMRWRAFVERHSSEYAYTLTTQLDRAQLAISQSMTFLAQLLVALVYVTVALWIAPLLSLLALVGGALLVLLTRRYARAMQASGEELNTASQRLHTAVVEHLSNMKVAKSFAAEPQYISHFEASNRAVLSTWAATGAAIASSRWAFSVGAAAMLAVVVYAGVTAFALAPAAILLLLYVFGRLVPRVGALQQLLHQILHAAPALRASADALHDFEREVEPRPVGTRPPLTLSRQIRLVNVAFSYVPGRPVFAGLSFDIPAGEVTVIMGPSGAGKTTVADLLLGLLEPDDGVILVDGERLDGETVPAWRRSVAYVPQEAVLFDDTVRNNLRWAVPEAGDDLLRQALEGARAGFVYEMPHGIETMVGERGSRLSGGERQRLAIARALLRRPRLLLLDEPTSNLDPESEAGILELIKSLRGDVTVVVISHREAVLSIADRVLVLQRGKVIHMHDRGTAVNSRTVALA